MSTFSRDNGPYDNADMSVFMRKWNELQQQINGLNNQLGNIPLQPNSGPYPGTVNAVPYLRAVTGEISTLTVNVIECLLHSHFKNIAVDDYIEIGQWPGTSPWPMPQPTDQYFFSKYNAYFDGAVNVAGMLHVYNDIDVQNIYCGPTLHFKYADVAPYYCMVTDHAQYNQARSLAILDRTSIGSATESEYESKPAFIFCWSTDTPLVSALIQVNKDAMTVLYTQPEGAPFNMEFALLSVIINGVYERVVCLTVIDKVTGQLQSETMRVSCINATPYTAPVATSARLLSNIHCDRTSGFVASNLEVDGDTKIRGELDVTKDINAGGSLSVGESITANDLIVLVDTTLKNLTVTGKAQFTATSTVDIDGTLHTTGDVELDYARTNDLRDLENHSILHTDETSGVVSVGAIEHHTMVRSKDRPTINDDGTSQEMAYLSDIVNSIEYQGLVTTFAKDVASIPTGVLNAPVGGTEFPDVLKVEDLPAGANGDYCYVSSDPLPELNGWYVCRGTPGAWYKDNDLYRFRDGDLALVGDPAAVHGDTATLTMFTYDEPNRQWIDATQVGPIVLAGQETKAWQWHVDWQDYAGHTGREDGYYHPGELLWSPYADPVASGGIYITMTDVPMQNYYDKGEIDQKVHLLEEEATTQADWINNNRTTVNLDGNEIDNPAYIRNRAIVGMSILNGGDWSNPDWNFDWFIQGGNWDRLGVLLDTLPTFAALGTYTPSPTAMINDYVYITADETKAGAQTRYELTDLSPPVWEYDAPISDWVEGGIRQNVVYKVWSGLRADLPPATAKTKHTLKFCHDTHELFIDMYDHAPYPGTEFVQGNKRINAPSEQHVEWINTQPEHDVAYTNQWDAAFQDAFHITGAWYNANMGPDLNNQGPANIVLFDVPVISEDHRLRFSPQHVDALGNYTSIYVTVGLEDILESLGANVEQWVTTDLTTTDTTTPLKYASTTTWENHRLYQDTTLGHTAADVPKSTEMFSAVDSGIIITPVIGIDDSTIEFSVDDQIIVTQAQMTPFLIPTQVFTQDNLDVLLDFDAHDPLTNTVLSGTSQSKFIAKEGIKLTASAAQEMEIGFTQELEDGLQEVVTSIEFVNNPTYLSYNVTNLLTGVATTINRIITGVAIAVTANTSGDLEIKLDKDVNNDIDWNVSGTDTISFTYNSYDSATDTDTPKQTDIVFGPGFTVDLDSTSTADHKIVNVSGGGGGGGGVEYYDSTQTLPAVGQEGVLYAWEMSDGTLRSFVWESPSGPYKRILGETDYMTIEHATGRKWVDGSDIYEKTFYVPNWTPTATPSESLQLWGSSAQMFRVLDVQGHCTLPGNVRCRFPYTSNPFGLPITYMDIVVTNAGGFDNGVLYIECPVATFVLDMYVTVQYIKP